MKTRRESLSDEAFLHFRNAQGQTIEQELEELIKAQKPKRPKPKGFVLRSLKRTIPATPWDEKTWPKKEDETDA
jgi:hypothetical protein